MDEYGAHGSLQLLIGELIYENQLLREAITSKDEVIHLIINHLTMTTELDCSCGVGSQVALVQDMVKAQGAEFARRRGCCFNGSGDIESQIANSMANPASHTNVGPTEKVELRLRCRQFLKRTSRVQATRCN
jgi:hypothetical protein